MIQLRRQNALVTLTAKRGRRRTQTGGTGRSRAIEGALAERGMIRVNNGRPDVRSAGIPRPSPGLFGCASRMTDILADRGPPCGPRRLILRIASWTLGNRQTTDIHGHIFEHAEMDAPERAFGDIDAAGCCACRTLPVPFLPAPQKRGFGLPFCGIGRESHRS
jgi:hypothetical protein